MKQYITLHSLFTEFSPPTCERMLFYAEIIITYKLQKQSEIIIIRLIDLLLCSLYIGHQKEEKLDQSVSKQVSQIVSIDIFVTRHSNFTDKV